MENDRVEKPIKRLMINKGRTRECLDSEAPSQVTLNDDAVKADGIDTSERERAT